MGGHGGLNILPQKRWNVYNYENREKVRRDEEEAARQEQLKREQAQKRDAEFRLEQLRTARGLAPITTPTADEPKQGHINLFEGIKIFDPINCGSEKRKEGDDDKKNKKKKEESVGKVVTAEDEKYRLGYGVAGKGVKLPWYLHLERQRDDLNAENGVAVTEKKEEKKKKKKKKSVDELREERLRRERREKERESTLLMENKKRDRASAFITHHIKSSSRSTRTRRR